MINYRYAYSKSRNILLRFKDKSKVCPWQICLLDKVYVGKSFWRSVGHYHSAFRRGIDFDTALNIFNGVNQAGMSLFKQNSKYVADLIEISEDHASVFLLYKDSRSPKHYPFAAYIYLDKEFLNDVIDKSYIALGITSDECDLLNRGYFLYSYSNRKSNHDGVGAYLKLNSEHDQYKAIIINPTTNYLTRSIVYFPEFNIIKNDPRNIFIPLTTLEYRLHRAYQWFAPYLIGKGWI
jgi:hypothetical protein